MPWPTIYMYANEPVLVASVTVLYCIESTSALQSCGCDPHAGFACATHHSVHHHLVVTFMGELKGENWRR